AFAVVARQLDVALERGSEGREVVGSPGLAPALVVFDVRARKRGREVARHTALPLPIAARDPHDVGVERTELGAVELGEPRPALPPALTRWRPPERPRPSRARTSPGRGRSDPRRAPRARSSARSCCRAGPRASPTRRRHGAPRRR